MGGAPRTPPQDAPDVPTILSRARGVARRVRDLKPSAERAMLRRLEQEGTNHPRYTHGSIDVGSYHVEYADALTVWPQWDDIFVRKALAFAAATDAPRILDCGANVGLASMYFKREYPNASITAFEADPAIAEICRRNLATLPAPSVDVHAAAVWTSCGTVEFICEGSDSGAIASLEPSVNGRHATVPAIRLADWLTERIDLLKVDIEGAELPVLEDCIDHLHCVQNIALDVHEFDPSCRQTGRLFAVLTKAGFVFDMTNLVPIPRGVHMASPFPAASPTWAAMVHAWRP